MHKASPWVFNLPTLFLYDKYAEEGRGRDETRKNDTKKVIAKRTNNNIDLVLPRAGKGLGGC
jgi:hypothetical protein